MIDYDDFVGRQIALTAKALRGEIERRLSGSEASLATWIVLKGLTRPDSLDGISQRELADWMGIEPPTALRHLDRLEADGLLARRRDERDRRVMRVSITGKGREKLRQLGVVMGAADAELRAQLTPRELEVMRSALQKLETYVVRNGSAVRHGEQKGTRAHAG